jgi:hypothetical protein
MLRQTNTRWALLLTANVLFICVLSFYRVSDADPPVTNLPFANSVEQRIEMINQLKELNAQIKEQNALLRSGTLHVVVADPKRR